MNAAPAIIRCRPDNGPWLLVIIFGGLGGLCLAMPWPVPAQAADAGWSWVSGSAASLMLIPALVLAAWLLRAQVAADKHSLRWRGLGGWRSAPWPTIADFYETPSGRGQALTIIETDPQKLRFSHSVWSRGLQPLRQAIEQNATSAAFRQWGVLGLRPGEQRTLVFEYDQRELRALQNMLGVCTAIWLAMWLFAMGLPTPSKLLAVTREVGWLLTVLMVIVELALALCLPLMALPVVLSIRQTRRQQHQRIIADAFGLVFEDGARRIAAPWEEVIDYYTEPFAGIASGSRHVIVTSCGTFDFTHHLRDVVLLAKMIQHYARAAQATSWQSRRHEVIGHADLPMAIRSFGKSSRVYSYRTRTNRALLWLLTAYPLMIGLPRLLLVQAGLAGPNITDTRPLGLVLGALSLWGWWRYRSAFIWTNDQGIGQSGLFGRRFIRWSEVRSYRKAGGDVMQFGVVRGDRERIWFWLGIADAGQLTSEIEQRAEGIDTKASAQRAPDTKGTRSPG